MKFIIEVNVSGKKDRAFAAVEREAAQLFNNLDGFFATGKFIEIEKVTTEKETTVFEF